ncbi:MAG TPA: sulfotransferase [Solirubrobacterales bacterium]|jgi:Sulfotransferase family|nr:sulfotransferase [Solirubrobacterales bacterium]
MIGKRRFDEDRLVWIMGSSRSGSTWLLRMLAELDGVVPIDDPHIGHHLGLWRPIPLAWASASEEPELTTLRELKGDKPGYFFADRYAATWRPHLRELIRARFAVQAAEGGHRKPLVVVKEPGSQAAGWLLSLFPRSRLVFLLRDGRDVVDSWLAAYREGAWAQEEGAFPLAEHGREAFIRWQASVWAYRTRAVASAYDAHDAARRVLVRYEDMIQKPSSALARICAMLGVKAGPDELAAIAAAHDIDAVPTDERGADQPVRNGCSGGWRHNLDAHERRVMLEALGPDLARFGYLSSAKLTQARPLEPAA